MLAATGTSVRVPVYPSMWLFFQQTKIASAWYDTPKAARIQIPPVHEISSFSIAF